MKLPHRSVQERLWAHSKPNSALPLYIGISPGTTSRASCGSQRLSELSCEEKTQKTETYERGRTQAPKGVEPYINGCVSHTREVGKGIGNNQVLTYIVRHYIDFLKCNYYKLDKYCTNPKKKVVSIP